MQTLVITTSPGTVAVTAGDVDVTVAAPGRITELSDVADGAIAPLALLRGVAAGGRLEFVGMAEALNMRTRLFGVASPVGWARIRRGGGGAAIQHRAFSAPDRQVTWMVWLWGAGGGAGRSGSVDGGETRLLGPSPGGSELADTVAVAHGGYNGARYPTDPTRPRVSGVTPGEARSDDDYGQYLVIQGAGGMGGRESLSYPERGENGALAIRVYRPVPGALYRVHVGVGGSSRGPDGDAGAAMIIEIG